MSSDGFIVAAFNKFVSVIMQGPAGALRRFLRGKRRKALQKLKKKIFPPVKTFGVSAPSSSMLKKPEVFHCPRTDNMCCLSHSHPLFAFFEFVQREKSIRSFYQSTHSSRSRCEPTQNAI